MYRLVIRTLFFISFLSFSIFASAEEDSRKWKKVKDKNGIKVYRAHTENSRLKTFRAVTRVELDNIHSFVEMMTDVDSYPQWVHMSSGAEITNTDDPRVYQLMVETGMPWPVKDRHTVLDVNISQMEDYSVRFDLQQSKLPSRDPKGSILCPEAFGYYQINTIPDSKEVDITVEVFVDPGGYVPAFLLNLITDDVSYFTTRKMRRYIQKDKYKNAEIDFIKRRPWVVNDLDDSTQG